MPHVKGVAFTRPADPSVMQIFTIYDHPSDYADKWVIKEWFIVAGKEPVRGQYEVADTLKEARDMLPDGLVLVPGEEHSSIHESWI